MKKDLTFNVDDYLKRLETIHEINFQDIPWGKGLGEILKKEINHIINSRYDLNQYNLYHLNANYFVQYYDFFDNTRPEEFPLQIYFYLITYKYTVLVWAEKINEVFLNFKYHINKVNDNDIEEIKTIFLEFMENIDFKDKSLFFSDIKNLKIHILGIDNSIDFNKVNLLRQKKSAFLSAFIYCSSWVDSN